MGRRLILKQEIHGKYIPIIVSNFLSSYKGESTGRDKVDEIRNIFTEKMVGLKNLSLDFDMYVDDSGGGINGFDDFTIVVELYQDNERNGLREN